MLMGDQHSGSGCSPAAACPKNIWGLRWGSCRSALGPQISQAQLTGCAQQWRQAQQLVRSTHKQAATLATLRVSLCPPHPAQVAVCSLLPLAFCLLGDTAEFYIAPIMAHVSQAIPKMRPRFAGGTDKPTTASLRGPPARPCLPASDRLGAQQPIISSCLVVRTPNCAADCFRLPNMMSP